ncbi:hypothetical protein EHS39_08960 [Ensifer sp. MPMI2T]|nr:hypothetical protein EHS39_08960 [Ensifer sp. MPMI2T]
MITSARLLCPGIFIAGIAYASSVFAQNSDLGAALARLEGTLNVQAQPHMNEGKIIGCQYVFDALMRDWSYRQGGYIKVSGSVAIMGLGGKIGTTVKVVVNEIDPATMTTTPSAPSRVYLIGSDFRTNVDTLVSSTESDVPGGRFSVYQMSPTTEMILEAMQNNRLTVAFNRRDGKTDLQLPVELDVLSTDDNGKRTRSERNGSAFAQCMSVVLKEVDAAQTAPQ